MSSLVHRMVSGFDIICNNPNSLLLGDIVYFCSLGTVGFTQNNYGCVGLEQIYNLIEKNVSI